MKTPMPLPADPTALSAMHAEALQALNARQPALARPLLEQLTEQAPDNPDYWDHLLAACAMEQRYAQADQAFRRCLALGRVYPEARRNALSNAIAWAKQDRRQHQRVLEYAEPLLDCVGPDRTMALQACAEALNGLGQPGLALAACRQLLFEQPANLEARLLTARLSLTLDEPEASLAQAEQLFNEERALSFEQRFKMLLLRIESLTALGRLDDALALATDESTQAMAAEQPAFHSALCFFGQYSTNFSVAQRRELAERFAQVSRREAVAYRDWPNPKALDRVMRIGLVSGDLRQHPVGFFIKPFLEHYSRDQLRIYVYDSLDQADAFTAPLKHWVADWRVVSGLSDAALAEQIRADGIDILIDLHGHTTGNRLGVFARKPAPVQVSALGFLGTTGLREIDYVFADPISVPPEHDGEFVEQVWRLPHYYCFADPDLPVRGPLPAREQGFLTFGSLNKPEKLNDTVLSLWGELLRCLPHSRLLLKGKAFKSSPTRVAFQARLGRLGMDLDSVYLEGPAPRPEFLSSYQRIDIALDPFPYGGGTTTTEALWAGVPVLTILGDRMLSRMSASLLHQVGLDDWVAKDPADFLNLAMRHSADLDFLAERRERLQREVLDSSLFDGQGFARLWTKAFTDMWRRYCEHNNG